MKKILNLKEIIKKIEERRDEISKYGVKKIGIFGSFAKDCPKKKSDIDVLIVMDNPNFDDYMDLKIMLEKLFKREIDLVIEEDLKPELNYVKKETKYAKLQ